ncbi:MAG TPA: hypothetical protein VES42_05765 [Pilimelia sp.]|nr:hypothetical protein [Pilimelia sp.]
MLSAVHLWSADPGRRMRAWNLLGLLCPARESTQAGGLEPVGSGATGCADAAGGGGLAGTTDPSG